MREALGSIPAPKKKRQKKKKKKQYKLNHTEVWLLPFASVSLGKLFKSEPVTQRIME
jgi:hypothetical protein